MDATWTTFDSVMYILRITLFTIVMVIAVVCTLATVHDGIVHLYYGGADRVIGLATAPLGELGNEWIHGSVGSPAVIRHKPKLRHPFVNNVVQKLILNI